MEERIKLICFVLIALAILTSAGFYCWSVFEKQAYFESQEEFQDYHSKSSDRILFPEE